MTQMPEANHASAAADAPMTARQERNLEVERLSKRARDLRTGLHHLTEVERLGVNCKIRRAMLGAKLARVEGRIFRLLQMPLFPAGARKNGRTR